jgi:hypothetical protein
MALPISRLDIVNQALTELGRLPVTNINDSEDATLLDVKLNLLLPVLLQETVWNFAILYREDSTPLTTPLTPDFSYTYQLPADYGRMFQFGNINNNLNTPYLISNNLISTNEKPISYYYIIDDVNVDAISTMFFRAIVLFIASDACLVLTENEKLTQYLKAKYEEEKGKAVNLNDMERYITTKPNNDYDRNIFV